MKHAVAAMVFAAATGALASACYVAPKVGEACDDAELSCFDSKTALECVGGVRLGVHCGGAKGCRSDARNLVCDQSEASENDLCLAVRMQAIGDSACSPDHKSFLSCEQGRFVTMSVCRGPRGCARDGGLALCDQSLAEAGDACQSEQKATCAMDGRHLLQCKDRKFETAAACEGEAHCQVADRQVHCDQRVGTIGAPCQATAACTADKTTMLACKDHVWAAISACRGPEACSVSDNNVGCDTSIAVAGELCGGEGASCAADGKTLLKCANGKWAVERACPRACELVKAEHAIACK
jgi:hypothetical protein